MNHGVELSFDTQKKRRLLSFGRRWPVLTEEANISQ